MDHPTNQIGIGCRAGTVMQLPDIRGLGAKNQMLDGLWLARSPKDMPKLYETVMRIYAYGSDVKTKKEDTGPPPATEIAEQFPK